MKAIFKYYRKYAHLIIASLLFLTLEAICELQLPSYMSGLVSEGIGQSDMGVIWSYGWRMLVITLIACVCSVLVGYFSAKVSARVSRDLRSSMFAKVMAFANEEYNKFSVSSLITRCTNDITQIQMLTYIFLRMIMFAPIMGIGGTIKAIQYSAGISALAFVIVGAIAIVMAAYGGGAQGIDGVKALASAAGFVVLFIYAIQAVAYVKVFFVDKVDE